MQINAIFYIVCKRHRKMPTKINHEWFIECREGFREGVPPYLLFICGFGAVCDLFSSGGIARGRNFKLGNLFPVFLVVVP